MSANQPLTQEQMQEQVVQALRTVYDPEIPINIYELGLIYSIQIAEPNIVHLQMTLTAPSCPEAQTLPGNAEAAVRSLSWVNDVKLEMVWDPPWTKENMTEEARLLLGIF